MDAPRKSLQMIRMPQGRLARVSLLADLQRIYVRDHPQCSRNTPGLHRVSQARLKDTPDGFMDLGDTRG